MLDIDLQIKLLIQERPWEHEPDQEEWVHELTGYKCTVRRHQTLGSLNGYVAIPKGHRVWGYGYDDVDDADVHGGLTYAEEDKETGEWVFGFDCSHGGDFSPKLLANIMRFSSHEDLETMLELKLRTEVYRTFEWVKAEVCSLARQLKMLDMKGNSI
jgi:hypothetical protein